MNDISLLFLNALEENNYMKCKSMCQDYSSYINALIYHGQTPLMLAAKYGSLDLILLLLNYGADVNKSNGFGLTPLMISALYNHINIMNELIIHGADVNSTNFYGITALMMACSSGHFHCVNLLLVQPLIIIDAQDKLNENTALHHALLKKKKTIVDLLLYHGADISLYNKKDETPLFLIEKNNKRIILHTKSSCDKDEVSNGIRKTIHFYTECLSI
jgi:ankyrin repeat protein